MKASIFTLALLFIFISCDKPNTTNVASDDAVQVVSSAYFSNVSTDDYHISAANIVGDRLEITVNAGGGCGELNFSLLANELVIETSPEQQMIRLILDDQDICEALLEEKRWYDISSLKIGSHGTVILLLDGFDGRLEYKY